MSNDKCELPTLYWLPKLHKRPYKSRFISNSNHCSTTILSKHITSALTAIKDHVMKYSETAFSNSIYIYHLCFTSINFYDLSAWGGCWFVVYIRGAFSISVPEGFLRIDV